VGLFEDIQEIPLPDSLQGNPAPESDLYGDLLEGADADVALAGFSRRAREVLDALNQDDFLPGLTWDSEGMSGIDAMIEEMWSTGWNPRKNNLSLFLEHFGLMLAAAMLDVGTTKPVFRSPTNFMHFSLWHEERRWEWFPFHKMAKHLTSPHGESAQQMLDTFVAETRVGD